MGEEGDYIHIDSSIKIGCDESCFNVSLIVNVSYKTVDTNQIFLKRENQSAFAPRSFCLPA